MVESDHSETGQDVTSTNTTRQKDSIDKSAELSTKRPREGCIEDDKIELPNKKSRSEMDEQSSTPKDETTIPEANGNTMIVDEDKNSQGNGEAKLKSSTDDAENRDNADNASSADMETQEESQEEKSDDEKDDDKMETNQDAPDSVCEDKEKPKDKDEADKVILTKTQFLFPKIYLLNSIFFIRTPP